MASASTMKTMQSRVAVSRAIRPARSTVVVRASAESVDRRAVFGLAAAALGAVLAVPQEAKAIRLPSQEFTGGLVTGGGSMTKSPTAASMEGYTLEGFPGTKKPSYLEPGKKKALRNKAREQALKTASKK
mmetsp:Transcript_27621/g.60446  ORF Transcript_27621/g.60446 Transcript_27621/m.60446 type:complete len:130 (+) Transcript_27621:45-434(+)|eukprot:CAMPEP_0202901534 /NCGR_PEP_ID=MMETSP1392-20130828/14308_1 /ASSEMBLY_ACC=CAM_ASM_000868 /TAXON_ID=225041 /ORGANISM="Chlamydomonas chlamydogama, Strain SAG 11-48b" /LENGTH=129 /DNA_ID=CAMNT_0049588107 /DNA_START=49 /DNA_END=438 /DNA_ORIENTATION=-